MEFPQDISDILNIASWVLILAGGAFMIIGAIGMLRLPDFFSRIHAAGVVDTLGVDLMLLGLLLQAGLTLVGLKLALIGLFIFFTSPTATHAVANAAWIAGHRPWTKETNKEEQPS